MVQDDLRDLLQKNLEVSQESLKILKKINRARIFSNIFSFLKWLIIIGVSIGAYYYIQPYLGKMLEIFNTASSGMNELQKLMPR